MIGEVPAARRARISRHEEATRRVGELNGLRAWNEAEAESVSIGFRSCVFVTNAIGQRQARRYFPLVLPENRVLPLMFVARGLRELIKFIGSAKEKICKDWGLSSMQFNRVLYRARERYRELYETASIAS